MSFEVKARAAYRKRNDRLYHYKLQAPAFNYIFLIKLTS